MYKYEDLILPYISGKYNIDENGILKMKCETCSFCNGEDTFSINMDLNKGLYYCTNGCRI